MGILVAGGPQLERKQMALLDPRVILAILLALLIAYGGGRWQQSHADAKVYDAERTKTALVASQAQEQAVANAKQAYQDQVQKQSKLANDAQDKANQARADADAARAASDRLRVQLAGLRSAPKASDSPAAGPSQAAADASSVLADVLGESVERNRQLAESLDASRIAGQACVDAYEVIAQ